jgi:hypothetical protein
MGPPPSIPSEEATAIPITHKLIPLNDTTSAKKPAPNHLIQRRLSGIHHLDIPPEGPIKRFVLDAPSYSIPFVRVSPLEGTGLSQPTEQNATTRSLTPGFISGGAQRLRFVLRAGSSALDEFQGKDVTCLLTNYPIGTRPETAAAAFDRNRWNSLPYVNPFYP